MARWFVLLLLFTTGFLQGQETEALTMDDAIMQAVKNNRQLEIARLEMQKADAQVKEAYGYAMPTLSFGGTYTHTFKTPEIVFTVDTMVSRIKIGTENSYQMGFNASQVLFNSIVFTGVGTAKIYQKASRELYLASYNTTIANVKRAFYNVLLAQQVHETTKASMANAEENFKNVKILHAQGIISDYDLIRSEVQVENIRPMVIESEQRVLVATNALKVQLGLNAESMIAVKGLLDFTPVDSTLLDPSRAAAENAGLKALNYQKQVTEELIAINRSEYLPTLSAFGNYQWQAQRNNLSVRGKDFVASSQAGLTLSINLFSGMQTVARIRQAIADKQKAQQQINDTRETLKTQMQNIALRLDEARKRVAGQSRTVELAEKSYKIAKTRYSTGSGTQLELNDAELSLTRARLNRIQAIYDYSMAKADLEELISYHDPK
ncbi:TolC family protein [bacterium]|nr:TolC family protein [bacterium]